MINNIFKSSVNYVANTKDIKNNVNQEVNQPSKKDETNKAESTTDKYEKPLSKNDQRKQISYIVKQAEQQTRNFETLVSSTFLKQSNKVGIVNKGYNDNFYKILTTDSKDLYKAKKDISEDGYYGVNQTSERILSFAKSVSGDNPKKIQEMRDAVEKGFKKAEKMWGDKLPEISQKTYDKVMEQFDKWQEKDTQKTEQNK
ncbi:hypothetical protein [uncultured Tyzzerella sp.]|uniref:hypothetical protein n=1 Tax=uncultured Tyzzerella sp. TaxID=2321398 RepID=UPI0029425FFA|nr:hypothetical protein [uncultured Tyzzerella sp.]